MFAGEIPSQLIMAQLRFFPFPQKSHDKKKKKEKDMELHWVRSSWEGDRAPKIRMKGGGGGKDRFVE